MSRTNTTVEHYLWLCGYVPLHLVFNMLSGLFCFRDSSTVGVLNDKEEGSSEKEEGSSECGEYRIEVLSEKPRVSLVHNFLSEKECEHLINLARPHMKRSLVWSTTKTVGFISKSRTSSGTFLTRGQDEVVRVIEKRIADFISIPIERGANLQVLHYAKGQKFKPHSDYFLTKIPENGGQCIATILMYLSDVKRGGETVFPKAKGNFCFRMKGGLAVKPKKGTALLFWNTHPDGTVDPLSMHGGSPVVEGDKWSCTKWIYAREYKCS